MRHCCLIIWLMPRARISNPDTPGRHSDTPYRVAAIVLAQVAERDPDSGALWQNIGLCRAWDRSR